MSGGVTNGDTGIGVLRSLLLRRRNPEELEEPDLEDPRGVRGKTSAGRRFRVPGRVARSRCGRLRPRGPGRCDATRRRSPRGLARILRPGERGEDTLGEIRHQVTVDAPPHGSRMHRGQVPADDLAERLLGIRTDGFRETLPVRVIVHCAFSTGEGGSRQMNSAAIRSIQAVWIPFSGSRTVKSARKPDRKWAGGPKSAIHRIGGRATRL